MIYQKRSVCAFSIFINPKDQLTSIQVVSALDDITKEMKDPYLKTFITSKIRFLYNLGY